MSEYRTEVIKKATEALAFILSAEQIETVAEEMTKALDGYDVQPKHTEIVPYDGANEVILKRFMACLLIGGKSEKTIAQYRRTAEKLAKSVQKHYTDMDVYDVRLFLAYEKSRGVSSRTIENTRANLSSFFQWLTQEDLIAKNPCMTIDPIKYPEKVRLPFSSVEIDALRLACKTPKERAIVELLLSSGVRVSEMTNMRIEDVNFNDLSIHVTKGKGSKERTAYMNELARTHLQTYLIGRKETGSYLFYNHKHEQLNPGGVRHILKMIADRAGVTNVHPHRFRRTFASGLANRGMDIQEIKKLLGHSDINTTLEYVYTSDEKVQISYKRYSA